MGTERVSLDGEWALRWCDAGEGEAAGWHGSGVAGAEAIPGRVPGMTHLDLQAAGAIEDPLFGENARACEWMEDKDWWYSRTFELSADDVGDRVEIVFEGLDCFADVWVNGKHTGSSRNALVPWRGDITGSVKAGENLVVVRVDTGMRWAAEHWDDRYHATGSHGGREPLRVMLRHSQFSFRWDWAPRLVTCGMWQPVRVESHREVALRDVCLRSRLGPGGEAILTALVEVEVFGEDERDVVLGFSLGDEAHSAEADTAEAHTAEAHTAEAHTAEAHTALRATVVPGHNLVTHEFCVRSPRLWWPNGLGAPHLYSFSCRIKDGESGRVLGERSFPYGIREVRVEQKALPGDEGQSFTFVVNGVPVFAKGGNWVPADSLVSRVTREKYEALVREACGASFNMLRIWGGGTYEQDGFWDACDRLGIMVWLDFQFACNTIPEDRDDFRAEVEREAELVVRRLRNRPSLALWCGNNENQAIYRGHGRREPAFYGFRTYHEILPKACARLDPTRMYWPSSPYGGKNHGDWDIGDSHSWQVSLMGEPPGGLSDYTAMAKDRSKFVSEYGFLAPPVRETLETALPSDELRVGSPSWQFHANPFETGIPVGGAESVLVQAVEKHFGRRAAELDLDAFIRLTQAWQAEAYRYSLSHFRRRKFLTSGTIFWMYNDCWVATSGWTIIDYHLRRKPSYYAVKRAFAPEMLSFVEDGDGVSLWLVNDHVTPVEGVLEYGVGMLSDGSLEVLGTANELVPENCSRQLLALPKVTGEEGEGRYYWAHWLRDGRLMSWHYHWLCRWGEASLPDAELQWKVERSPGDEHVLEVSSDRYAWMVAIEPEAELGPEENHFDLLPGRPRRIAVHGRAEALEKLTVSASNHLLRR